MVAGLALLVITIATSPSAVLATSLPNLEGEPLAEALRILQERGLKIVFSDAIVKPSMVVSDEPSATDLRVVLDEILAPHNLGAENAPGGVVIVVPATGTIRGLVEFDFDSPLAGSVLVTVLGGRLSTTVDENGVFVLGDIPVGEYTLEANAPGCRRRRIDHVGVRSDQITVVLIHLESAAVFLNEIVVTPSHFRLLELEPESRLFLSRDDVDQMPHVADDLYRAIKRLPGAAGGDYSAKFSVRGGEQEELLVILDGLELYEPFHLKDFQNIFSVVDTETVGGVDFLTGGFPAEYGDRMSGVMDISTLTPTGPASTTIGVSTLNSRVVSQGSFNDDRGQWLVNVRKWYPDTVVNLVRSTSAEVLTDYYDCLAKVQHRIGSHSTLSGNILFSYDDLSFATEDEEGIESVTAHYRSHHLWFNLRTDWSEALFSEVVLSSGRVRRQRIGGYEDLVDGSLDVEDRRTVDFVGLKQDWTMRFNDHQFLKAGVEVKRQEALYDYSSVLVNSDPAIFGSGADQVSDIELTPAGTSYGAYVADRVRLSTALVAEVGLRWDRQFYVGDHQISPRLNLLYQFGPQTTLRASWGQFYQSQRLNELQVEDNVTEFFPAQLAEHSLASIEHHFDNGLALRFEAYRKNLSDLKPRYENLFNPLEMFPEAADDRIRIAPDWGRSQGLEILVRRNLKQRMSWWFSYVLASAEDHLDGEYVSRSWDQRHAASFGLSLDLGDTWKLNLAGAYHSGWPTTKVTLETKTGDDGEIEYQIVLGPRNRERYPSYLRFDARVSRSFHTRFGLVELMFEVINLTNRENVCCIEEFDIIEDEDGTAWLKTEERHWAPIIPSIGVNWTF